MEYNRSEELSSSPEHRDLQIPMASGVLFNRLCKSGLGLDGVREVCFFELSSNW